MFSVHLLFKGVRKCFPPAGRGGLWKQGNLILPVAMPAGFSIDDWMANGGLCFEIAYSPTATNLLAHLRAPGAPEHPFEFVPFVE